MDSRCPLAARLALLLSLALPASGHAGQAPGTPRDDAALCARAAARFESNRLIPTALLRAVALTETGRKIPGGEEIVAWPWTVNAGGRGRFFASRDAAIAHVRSLRARGVRNIDVGCMQINLMYHPEAFASLEQAFDPVRNTAYAAAFLVSLREETRSITRAVARYHSNDRTRGRSYWRRVLEHWNETRRKVWEERRRARVAQRDARRAARRAALRARQSFPPKRPTRPANRKPNP